jgi:hypothetical protein
LGLGLHSRFHQLPRWAPFSVAAATGLHQLLFTCANGARGVLSAGLDWTRVAQAQRTLVLARVSLPVITTPAAQRYRCAGALFATTAVRFFPWNADRCGSVTGKNGWQTSSCLGLGFRV